MEEIQNVHKKYALKNLKNAAPALCDWQQHLERLNEAVPAKEVQDWLQWALLEIFEMNEFENFLNTLDPDCPFLHPLAIGVFIEPKNK